MLFYKKQIILIPCEAVMTKSGQLSYLGLDKVRFMDMTRRVM